MSDAVGDLGYTQDEMMTVAASRLLTDGMVIFVGIGLPSAAANLARLTHAPEIALIYESGTIATRPNALPLSIGDGELAETARTVVSVPEMFRYWLQGGRIDVGFLGAAQIDKYGNINTSYIGGTYQTPKVRLPGGGGAPEIATQAGEIFVIMRQSPRGFVNRLDFVTSLGGGPRREEARAKGHMPTGKGPSTIITDLGVLKTNPNTDEFILTDLHQGCSAEQAKRATGWDLKVAEQVGQTEPPSVHELSVLRALTDGTAKARDDNA